MVNYRLLHRCPLRNVLINSMVYVSGMPLLPRKVVKDGGGNGDGETDGVVGA